MLGELKLYFSLRANAAARGVLSYHGVHEKLQDSPEAVTFSSII
jgi:hypothetical protein